MARERKTIDTWELHVNYGYGYEHECTETTRHEWEQTRRDYEQNCGYPFRLVTKRVPKSEFSESELADIERKKREHAEERRRRREERRKERLAKQS